MYTLHERDVDKLELQGRTCIVLVGNEKLRAKNITFGVTYVPAKSKMYPHKHEKEEEVIYIIEGYGEIMINGTIEKIKDGSVIYLPIGLEHYIENKSNDIMKFIFSFSPTVKIGSYDK